MTLAPLHIGEGEDFKVGPSVIFHRIKYLNVLPWRFPCLPASGENKLTGPERLAMCWEPGAQLATHVQSCRGELVRRAGGQPERHSLWSEGSGTR